MRLSVTACAKLNLGLRILGRRPDGYHDIVSVFQEISLCDRLEIEAVSGRGSISVSCPEGLSEGPGNLAWKAAEAFMELSGESLDVEIALEKSIPLRAGLGGGSSDAAAVLGALSHITARTDIDLLEAASGIGSDVPFFLTGGTALVEGRGERLTRLRTVPFHAVLIHPDLEVSTPGAYSLWDETADAYLTEDGIPRHYSALSAVWHEGKPFPHDLRNDFLPLLEERIPGIAEVAAFMRRSCRDWGLSGSGPTFYALFRTEAGARRFSGSLHREHSLCSTAENVGASSNG